MSRCIEITGPSRFSLDSIPPQPSHPVPLKDSGVFYMARYHHDLANTGNMNGYINELKAGNLISKVSFVESVRQVEPEDDWDREMVDLVVAMVGGYPLQEVFVQIKSGRGSVYDFFNSVGKKLDWEFSDRDKSDGDDEYRRRRMWMRANRLIVINAGEKISGTVSDDYILNKFMREVEEIIDFDF